MESLERVTTLALIQKLVERKLACNTQMTTLRTKNPRNA